MSLASPAHATTDTPPRGSRRPFFIAMLLFMTPLALAFIVHYGFDWRPGGTTAKGELISPAVPLPQLALPMADGKHTETDFLLDKWNWVYLSNGECDATCRTALEATRNVRQLLTKDMTRVRRVFFYTGTLSDAQYFVDQQPDLLLVNLDEQAVRALLPLFPTYNGVAPLEAGRHYIVDPLGNLMMSYRADAELRDVYQDTKKLLKYSHIG